MLPALGKVKSQCIFLMEEKKKVKQIVFAVCGRKSVARFALCMLLEAYLQHVSMPALTPKDVLANQYSDHGLSGGRHCSSNVI